MLQYAIYAGLGGLLVGALTTGTLTYKYVNSKWVATTAQLQVEAAGLLADEVEKVVKRERTAQIRVRELELEHEATTDHLETLERANRTLAAQHGGVRDPGRRQGGGHASGGVTSQTPGTPNPSTCEVGVLSGELTEALITKAKLADDMTAYAWQGYYWSIAVEHALEVSDANH